MVRADGRLSIPELDHRYDPIRARPNRSPANARHRQHRHHRRRFRCRIAMRSYRRSAGLFLRDGHRDGEHLVDRPGRVAVELDRVGTTHRRSGDLRLGNGRRGWRAQRGNRSLLVRYHAAGGFGSGRCGQLCHADVPFFRAADAGIVRGNLSQRAGFRAGGAGRARSAA